MSEYAVWQRGHEDGQRGKADPTFLGQNNPYEQAYFRGFREGEWTANPPKPRKPAKLNTKAMKALVPAKLAAIPLNALKDAYEILLTGHCLDNVRTIDAKDPEDAMEAIRDALQLLAREFQDGSIRLYRTISIDNRQEWVDEELSIPRSLGIFYSRNEEFVQELETENRVLFCIYAPIASVDWAETICLTVDGVEDEVRLVAGKPVKLDYVEPEPEVSISAIHFA